MDIFYFLVSKMKWTNYHENFFNTEEGFAVGVIAAFIIGALIAIAFYFGCCNSSKSAKQANIAVWALALLLSGVVGYFYADWQIIGENSTHQSMFVSGSSFYEKNEKYYIEETSKNPSNSTQVSLNNTKNRIQEDLDKGNDVRFEFDLNTALLAIGFFFLTSILVKRFTIDGKNIPFMKP